MNPVDPNMVRLVLVGDSITQWWQSEPEWREHFGQPGDINYALNLGVAGDRTEDVLHRLMDGHRGGDGQLDDPAIKPDIITLMIGTNHLWDNRPDLVEAIGEGQMAVIARLRALRPDAHILVNAVLPTGDATINANVVRPVNAALRTATAAVENASCLDLYPAFVAEDGRARRELFPDGVHLNGAGYRVWQGLLLPALTSLRSHSN